MEIKNFPVLFSAPQSKQKLISCLAIPTPLLSTNRIAIQLWLNRHWERIILFIRSSKTLMIWDNQRAGSRGGGGMRFALPCGSSGQTLNAREWLDLVTEHGKGPKTSSQCQPWRAILIKQQPWQCLVQMLCSTILNCSFCDWFNMEIVSEWPHETLCAKCFGYQVAETVCAWVISPRSLTLGNLHLPCTWIQIY